MERYQQLDAGGPTVHFVTGDEASARVLAAATIDTAKVVKDRWHLTVPPGCRLYVLTDWEDFLEHATPRHLRLAMKLTKPLWRGRVERTFALAGGWTVPWRGRPTVAVKPARDLPPSESSLGSRLFEPLSDPVERVRHLTCHEFTHACTAHLSLPAWLNEGLAMRAVDHLAGRQTVLEESRGLVIADPSKVDGHAYRRVSGRDHDALLRLYATGYWTLRRLEEEHPRVLMRLLERRRRPKMVTREVRSLLRPV